MPSGTSSIQRALLCCAVLWIWRNDGRYKLRLAYTPPGVQQVASSGCLQSEWSIALGWGGMGAHLTLPILTLKSQAEFQQSHPGFLKWGEFRARRVPSKELLTTPRGEITANSSLPYHEHFSYYTLWFECEVSAVPSCV